MSGVWNGTSFEKRVFMNTKKPDERRKKKHFQEDNGPTSLKKNKVKKPEVKRKKC